MSLSATFFIQNSFLAITVIIRFITIKFVIAKSVIIEFVIAVALSSDLLLQNLSLPNMHDVLHQKADDGNTAPAAGTHQDGFSSGLY